MEARYLDLLDDEVIAFVQSSQGFYPPDASETSIEEQRKSYDALCARFSGKWPDSVKKSDRWLSSREGNILVREYRSDAGSGAAHILYFHGGGFILGSLDSHDSICAEFCAKTGMSVTAVDYRLSPEFPHPAAFEDCLNAFHRLVSENSTPIILAGDSAGGTLAAAVAHSVQTNHQSLIGQLLIYPALGGDKDAGSYVEHQNAPLLSCSDLDFYEQQRSAGRDLSLDATANPLVSDTFTGLPPTVIFTADCDPLADDGEAYEKALRNAGVKVKLFREKGLVHGFLRARSSSNRAGASFDNMIKALNMMAAKQWAF